ncbi:hypothetical protein EMCRGX_G011170 [Ephydatia muelleri]
MMRRIVVCAAVLLTVLSCQVGQCKNALSQERSRGDRAVLQTASGHVARDRGGNERIDLRASPVATKTAAARYSNCTNTLDVHDCMDSNVMIYRTFDGTCNNLDLPLNGAANRPMKQLLPPAYEDDVSLPVGYKQATSGQSFNPPWPSPRLISWKLFRDSDTAVGVPSTHMFMQWGQFLVHDTDFALSVANATCDCNFKPECLPILVSSDDEKFGLDSPHGGKCLDFVRSVPACKMESSAATFPRTPINSVTSYIDASMIYGNSKGVADSLRQFHGGLLKQGGEARVPQRIARALADINPCWSDQKLYDTTRKIVGAKIQVITYSEYLPLLFGPHYNTYVPPYDGYDPHCDATVSVPFATSAMRYGHSMVRPIFGRLNKGYKPLRIGPLKLAEAFSNPMLYYRSGGTDAILRGLLSFQSKAVDEFLSTVLTTQLFTKSKNELGKDLAATDIQRGRDQGQLPYRRWQTYCENLHPANTARFQRDETIAILKWLYGEDGFKCGMDLWPAGLSEQRLPGAMVGPTFACILGRTFRDLRNCDRFWYENPSVFTGDQLFELKEHSSLSKVICENADDIAQIQSNAFMAGERVSCNSIPDVDLEKWRDARCREFNEISD